MKLYFEANFNTDGDFGFYEDRLSMLFHTDNSMYKGATLDYEYVHDGEDIYIWLKAEGDSNACRWACRDLLNGLMCSIRTFRHHLVKDIYELLEYFYTDLWKEANQHKVNEMGGNYDNTFLELTMEE